LFVPLFLFICVFFSSLTILDWKFWIYNLIPSMYALIILKFFIFPHKNHLSDKKFQARGIFYLI
jgi:hypothetical protein